MRTFVTRLTKEDRGRGGFISKGYGRTISNAPPRNLHEPAIVDFKDHQPKAVVQRMQQESRRSVPHVAHGAYHQEAAGVPPDVNDHAHITAIYDKAPPQIQWQKTERQADRAVPNIDNNTELSHVLKASIENNASPSIDEVRAQALLVKHPQLDGESHPHRPGIHVAPEQEMHQSQAAHRVLQKKEKERVFIHPNMRAATRRTNEIGGEHVAPMYGSKVRLKMQRGVRQLWWAPVVRPCGRVIQRSIRFKGEESVDYVTNVARAWIETTPIGYTPAFLNGREIKGRDDYRDKLIPPSYKVVLEGDRYKIKMDVKDQQVSYKMVLPTKEDEWIHDRDKAGGPLMVSAVAGKIGMDSRAPVKVRGEADANIENTSACALHVYPDGRFKEDVMHHESHHVIELKQAVRDILGPSEYRLRCKRIELESEAWKVEDGPHRANIKMSHSKYFIDQSLNEASKAFAAALASKSDDYHATPEGQDPAVTAAYYDPSHDVYAISLSNAHAR